MAVSALFDKYRENQLKGSGSLVAILTDTIKMMLCDLDTADAGVKQISSSTLATPIVVTSNAHGYANGDLVAISGHLVNTNANGLRRVANVAANTYELTDPLTGANIVGNGVGIATGRAVNLTQFAFVDSFDGCRLGADQTLVTKTATNGIFDADDPVFPAVTGATCEAVILYQDTGVPATSRVILYSEDVTGLPFLPSGADYQLVFSSLYNRLFKL